MKFRFNMSGFSVFPEHKGISKSETESRRREEFRGRRHVDGWRERWWGSRTWVEGRRRWWRYVGWVAAGGEEREHPRDQVQGNTSCSLSVLPQRKTGIPFVLHNISALEVCTTKGAFLQSQLGRQLTERQLGNKLNSSFCFTNVRHVKSDLSQPTDDCAFSLAELHLVRFEINCCHGNTNRM